MNQPVEKEIHGPALSSAVRRGDILHMHGALRHIEHRAGYGLSRRIAHPIQKNVLWKTLMQQQNLVQSMYRSGLMTLLQILPQHSPEFSPALILKQTELFLTGFLYFSFRRVLNPKAFSEGITEDIFRCFKTAPRRNKAYKSS